MNFLFWLYFKLPNNQSLGLITKIFNRVVAKVLKLFFDSLLPLYFSKTIRKNGIGVNQSKRTKKIIVSLTSFPARIDTVWIAIECIFRQKVKADKVILWISREQFEGIELPQMLLNQKKRGLEIYYLNEDLKSHKKYIQAFVDFPNDYILTVDDDLYYDKWLIANLLELKEKYPNTIPSNRAHLMKFDNLNKLLPYSSWHHNYSKEIVSSLLLPTGGYGTMYEVRQLSDVVTKIDLIKSLAPHADDIWLRINSLLKGIKVSTNSRYNKDPITIKSSQLEKLVSKNVQEGGNDIQLRNLLNHFNLGELENYRNE